MSSREEHMRRVAGDRREGLERLRDATADRPKRNPLTAVARFGKEILDALRAKHPGAMGEAEIYDKVALPYEAGIGRSAVRSMFYFAVRYLKEARLIKRISGRRKLGAIISDISWAFDPGSLHGFLRDIEVGGTFTEGALAEFIRLSRASAAVSLKAAGELGLVRRLRPGVYEKAM